MLGAYFIPDAAPLTASADPRLARLRAAWPKWRYQATPGGVLAFPLGTDDHLDSCGERVTCADGLGWHAPLTPPAFYDLAREDIPAPSVHVHLRRIGNVSVPLGVGPVFGAGPKRGQPSSEFGKLAFDLHARSSVKDRKWTDEDEADVERLLFLALRHCYHITEEVFNECPPYDADEISPILQAIWGSDPKASASAEPTSPPPPLA